MVNGIKNTGHYTYKYLAKVFIIQGNGLYNYYINGTGNMTVIIRGGLVVKFILRSFGNLFFTMDFINPGGKSALGINILKVFRYFNIIAFIRIILVEYNVRGPDYLTMAQVNIIIIGVKLLANKASFNGLKVIFTAFYFS